MATKLRDMSDRLPSDILRSIALNLDSAADRVRFRAVSKSWRSALPFRHPPLLMVMSQSKRVVEFINAGEESVSEADLPGPEIKALLLQISRVVGSTASWAIAYINGSPKPTIHLLNPFSRAQLQLPAVFDVARSNLVKVVLSSSSPDVNIVVMGIYANSEHGMLAVTNTGDKRWTRVEGYPGMGATYFDDVVFYQQRFYAVTRKGKIAAWDTEDGHGPPQLSFLLDCWVEEELPEMSPMPKHYLVEVEGELVMVVRFLDLELYTIQFKMYKLDLGAMKFEELKALGEHSLFVGINTSASVLVPDYFGLGLVRRNCIYFSDDLVGNLQTKGDIGVFDLEDGSVTLHYEGSIVAPVNPAIWIVPQ